MLKRWVIWVVVMVAIVALGQGLAAAMMSRIPHTVTSEETYRRALSIQESMAKSANITLWVSWSAALIWLCVGFWWWRRVRWVRWAAFLILGTVLLYLITGSRLYLGPPWSRGLPAVGYYLSPWGLSRWSVPFAIGLSGIWAMTVFFLLGLALIRLVLRPGHPVLGVARTLVDEAIRMKIALIFIVLVVVVLPILPFVMNPAERLQYRIQSFITYAMSLGAVFLAAMTIFLACKTISDELEKRQIFLTLTKPVGRGQYLLGKWVGIMALNLLLVMAVGGATHLFTRIIEAQRDRGDADRWAVQEYVLVARDSEKPAPVEGMASMSQAFRDLFKQLYAEDPERYGGQYDLTRPDDLDAALKKLTPAQRKQIEGLVVAKWYSIPPLGRQTYRFTGLNRAKEFGRPVQLRFKVNSQKTETLGPADPAAPPPDTDRVTFALRLNGRFYPETGGAQAPIVVSANTFRVIDVPLDYVSEDGVLDAEVYNVNLFDSEQPPRVSLTFDPGEGLEVLYRVSSYEANLFRALLIVWVQLAFLAILGLAAGTFLGFPVAALLAIMVYVGSMAKGFLVESIGYFASAAPPGLPLFHRIIWPFGAFFSLLLTGKIWDAIKIPVALLGDAFVTVVPSFSDYNPIPLLADGRVISWMMVGDAFLWIGVVSAGFCAIVGWWIFRGRELARITV